MIKKITLIMTIILAGILLCLLWMDHQSEQASASRAAQMEKEIRPYRVQLNELDRQINELESYYTDLMTEEIPVTLLYTGAGEEIYTRAWDRMQTCGYPGSVLLSQDAFPGEDGCMTATQLLELVEDGWDWCLEWPEEETDPAAACEALAARAEDAGLGQASVIFFENSGDAELYAAWLSDNGYCALVDAAGWRDDNRRTRFDQAVNNGENLTYTIQLGQASGYGISDDMEYLDSMLKWMTSYYEDGAVQIVNAADASIEREHMDTSALEAEWQSKKEELEQQIEELQEKIKQIEDAFYDE